MRAFWIVFAFLLTLCLIPVVWSSYNNFMVYRFGTLIEVTIVKLPPSGISSNSKGDMTFLYNNKQFKKVVPGFNDHYIGEKIILKYLKGYENNFLYPNEDGTFVSITAMMMISSAIFGCIYYGYKRQTLRLE